MSPNDQVEPSIPEGGIVFDEFVLGLPTAADLDRLSATYAEPDAFTRAELAELVPHMNALVTVGRLVPLLVKDARTGEILGGGTFRNFDANEATVEIGYWLYPHARGRGVATRTARALAEHAFGLGVRRVVARVKAGNTPSERVLERAGFTCDDVGRAIFTAHGHVAKSIWSLRPAAENVVLVAVDTLEDWPLWRSARLAALADAPDAFPDAPADWLKGGEDQWRERLLQANAVKLVATVHDVPVGLVRGEIEAETAWLHSLWVSPRVRGRGLGKRLVHAVEAWGRPRSAYLRLAVVPGNAPALALYRRLGFTQTSRLGDPLADGTHELIMEKRLGKPWSSEAAAAERGRACLEPEQESVE